MYLTNLHMYVLLYVRCVFWENEIINYFSVDYFFTQKIDYKRCQTLNLIFLFLLIIEIKSIFGGNLLIFYWTFF